MKLRRVMSYLLLLVVAGAVAWGAAGRLEPQPAPGRAGVDVEAKRLAKRLRKRARDEYFFNLLRDPATNAIPASIRVRELAYARTLPRVGAGKTASGPAITWAEAGPHDVGGRTRALAVDVTDPNVILAGGVSGGIWKSVDGGRSWTLKTDPAGLLSVTSIAQDPRPGQERTWYAVSGEFSGSAADRGFTAMYYGSGVYRSTDGGETWDLMLHADDPTRWDSDFDQASRVVVNPKTGTVFAAVNATGILRSTDRAASFDVALGASNDHYWSDVAVASDGTILAALSQGWTAAPAHRPGLYRSADDGRTWTDVTPAAFPAAHFRSVVAFAPSNPAVAYVLTFTGQRKGDVEDVRFFRLDVRTGAAEDRTANLPNYGDPVGSLDSQGGYNLALAVRPDDEDFVVLGGTNLFRSWDGFATPPGAAEDHWIGGYSTDNDVSQYVNHHPDQHALAFDPRRPNRLWSGHDGGISLVDAVDLTGFVAWQDMNNGYNVTQFYTVALPREAGDGRIMGGTQDNGTPFFGPATAGRSDDVSTGDGAYAYFGSRYAYVSTQLGDVVRLGYDADGKPDRFQWTTVRPREAAGQLFIHPFAVDPVDEEVMYYPAGNVVWRNDALSSIPAFEGAGTNVGWTALSAAALPAGYAVSTVAVSESPAHRLYYAGYSSTAAPRLYRLDGAATATDGEVDVSIPGAPAGAYVHAVAVHPYDADEILVVLSNYNIVGLYHSRDGGRTYTAVEGNLEGTAARPGPSLRTAAIVPAGAETLYLVGTSTGVYSASMLAGAQTEWQQQAPELIGNVVVEYLAVRPSDGRIAVATHGRGVFTGTVEGVAGQAARASASVDRVDLAVTAGGTGSSTFLLHNTGGAPLSFAITTDEPRVGGAAAKATFGAFVTPRPGARPPVATAPAQSAGRGLLRAPGATRRATLAARADDYLVLDDGDATPDDFLGYGPANPRELAWYNTFDVGDRAFEMQTVAFFMRTEAATTNPVRVSIYDGNVALLQQSDLALPLSATGQWYEVTLGTPLRFEPGARFFVVLQTLGSAIPYAAGTDTDAAVTGQSYYWDYDANAYVGLHTIEGFEDGAFLIRAGGRYVDRENLPPNAVGYVSTLTPQVGETVTFDASQSTDPDGRIDAYHWDFGDGSESRQAVATHAYARAGTYSLVLTVTDDRGASAQVFGEVVVSGAASRLVVTPAAGTVAPGESETITVTFDARDVAAGRYEGAISIGGNGGPLTLPVEIDVLQRVANEDDGLPGAIRLHEAYPNPFNPSTVLRLDLPAAGAVDLAVYDALGRRQATLVQGMLPAGAHTIRFEARDLPSGLYFARLRSGTHVETRQLFLVR